MTTSALKKSRRSNPVQRSAIVAGVVAAAAAATGTVLILRKNSKKDPPRQPTLEATRVPCRGAALYVISRKNKPSDAALSALNTRPVVSVTLGSNDPALRDKTAQSLCALIQAYVQLVDEGGTPPLPEDLAVLLVADEDSMVNIAGSLEYALVGAGIIDTSPTDLLLWDGEAGSYILFDTVPVGSAEELENLFAEALIAVGDTLGEADESDEPKPEEPGEEEEEPEPEEPGEEDPMPESSSGDGATPLPTPQDPATGWADPSTQPESGEMTIGAVTWFWAVDLEDDGTWSYSALPGDGNDAPIVAQGFASKAEAKAALFAVLEPVEVGPLSPSSGAQVVPFQPPPAPGSTMEGS